MIGFPTYGCIPGQARPGTTLVRILWYVFGRPRARSASSCHLRAAASSAAIMDPHPAAAAAAARRRLGALTAHVVIAEAVSAASARAAVLGLAGRLVTRVGLSLERAAERAADAAADATDPDAVAPAGAAAASHSEPVATGVSAEGSVRVDLESLARFCAAAYERAGMPADAAASFGTTIAQTEAWRQSTHGIQQLFDGLNTLEGGIFKADAVPEIRRQSAGTAVIDGQRCMGQVAMELAKQVARKKAKQFGVAMVHVFNTGWLGALGNPLVELASEGLLAQAWCRSPTSADGKPPLDAAPFGGRESRLGTSPMAIAFPSGTQAESGASSVVVSDFSTAVMARSKANAMAAAGEMTSEPMFLEADGTPTCDPLSLVERGKSTQINSAFVHARSVPVHAY
jgi:hypothetical protein